MEKTKKRARLIYNPTSGQEIMKKKCRRSIEYIGRVWL